MLRSTLLRRLFCAFLVLVATAALVEPSAVREAALVLVVAVAADAIGPMLAVGLGPTLPTGAVCPACAGALGPWASYSRLVRVRGGSARLRLARARCRACRRTHALLPSFLIAYRRDLAPTIGTALAAAADGRGHRPLAAALGLPTETVRGWLRRARAQTAPLARILARLLGELGHLLPRPPPSGPLAWLLELLDAAHRVVRARLNLVYDSAWGLAVALTGGRLLAPPSRP